MKKNTPILINGRVSKIIKNKSDGKKWTLKNSNYETIKIIDELLKNINSDFFYKDGITILNPVTTVYLVSHLDISRPSNHIGIIRFESGSNIIVTYKSKGEKKPYYGVIKSKANIEKLSNLKVRILKRIGG